MLVAVTTRQPKSKSDAALATFVAHPSTAKRGKALHIEWSYDGAPLPESGLLLLDQVGHLLYLFNPPSVQTKPQGRLLMFVIDVSGSMSGQKLRDTKKAFQMMVSCCVETNDVIAVHSFSDRGTVSGVHDS